MALLVKKWHNTNVAQIVYCICKILGLLDLLHSFQSCVLRILSEDQGPSSQMILPQISYEISYVMVSSGNGTEF